MESADDLNAIIMGLCCILKCTRFSYQQFILTKGVVADTVCFFMLKLVWQLIKITYYVSCKLSVLKLIGWCCLLLCSVFLVFCSVYVEQYCYL